MAEARYCYRHPDRETGLSCSECGRPICVDCMTVAPVGIRCPDHAGAAVQTRDRKAGPVKLPSGRVAQPVRFRYGDAIVTKLLVAANVIVYLIGVAQGAGINDPDGSLYRQWWLYGPQVADGGWWRLITATFLHASILHIVFNMFALWWLGAPVEMALGHWRYLLLYIVSGLAGSAGALIANPHSVTVGASGAIFGLLGAGLILEYEATGQLAGNYLTLIIVNLVITFAIPGISVGGHIGGLIGGAVGALVLTQFGRGRPRTFADVGALHTVGLLAIGVVSVVIAYWRVRGLA
jgi:membrane associated rhomboid family serine protease